jgi:LuxR family maltose regulon positive regulatory protein
MSITVLSSKLYIPPHHPELMLRPRLIQHLDTGLSGKLTLVSAPAGFGKTTLVSEWVRHCGCPVAWLSLDKNDNDLARFLTYFIAALQRIDESIGVDIQSALSESQFTRSEPLLTRLVSEIEGVADKHILVIDDYHLINSKAVHDALNFLIEYLPRTTHLVVVGRTDPPLPISRLRVQGEVNEIRTPELRFTTAEVTILLNDMMGFNLPSEDITTIEARTEGWVASLKLASLSMQQLDDRHEFITAFSGSHRYVIDYLMDEVMTHQPDDIQTFLRRTSILDRFCAPLCESVTDDIEIEGNRIIDYLDRSNLFLNPLDDHREWYRYHHLFTDFLQQRLNQEEPDSIPELHRRASQWYETQGFEDEAIHHSFISGNQENTIRLVNQIAQDLVVRREFSKLLELMNQLQPERCQDYPMLCIWHAWALLFQGRLDVVESKLAIVEFNRDKVAGLPLPGYVTTVRAYLANQMGKLQKAIDLCEQALVEMSDSSADRITLIHRGAATIWLGVNHRFLANLHKARQYFDDAAKLNLEAGNIYGTLAAIHQSADIATIIGQLQQAEYIYRQGLIVAQKWMDEHGKDQGEMLAASGLHKGLGKVLYQRNELDRAAHHIQLAVKLDKFGNVIELMSSYRILAFLKQAEGDYVAAHDLYMEATRIRDKLDIHQHNISVEPSLQQLHIILLRTYPDKVHVLPELTERFEIQGLKPGDERIFSDPRDYTHEADYADLARSLIYLERTAEALPLLKRLLEAARKMARMGDEIRYLVLIAVAQHGLGDISSALNSLNQALSLAEPEGYVRIFVDEGKPMAELLASAISLKIAPEYASKLLAVFPKDIQQAVKLETKLPINAQPLVEPLSEREIDVLRLMAAGLKYREVAEKLVISINTVRHHTRNIYSKLNVNNRTQAIGRAKELHLL